jgi:tetratricopeptide (TPR) repeat protein
MQWSRVLRPVATSSLLMFSGCGQKSEPQHVHDQGNLNASELRAAYYGAAHGDAASMKRLKLHHCLAAISAEDCKRWQQRYDKVERQYLIDIEHLAGLGHQYTVSGQYANALTMYDGALALALQVREGDTTEVYMSSLSIGRCYMELGDLSEAYRYAKWASEVEDAIRSTNSEVHYDAAELLERIAVERK